MISCAADVAVAILRSPIDILEDEFRPDVALLSELLGRDLGEQWLKRDAASGGAHRFAASERS